MLAGSLPHVACRRRLYHLNQKFNSSLFEFLPKFFREKTNFCHDKCHHHLSPMIVCGAHVVGRIIMLICKYAGYIINNTQYYIKMTLYEDLLAFVLLLAKLIQSYIISTRYTIVILEENIHILLTIRI